MPTAKPKIDRVMVAGLTITRRHDLLVLRDGAIRLASSSTILNEDSAGGRIILARYQLDDAEITADSSGKFTRGCGPRVDELIEDINTNVLSNLAAQ
ncbi:hypothetical protein [Tsukamurella hominis]|uniref:hypothetical protein n=1 Tax=Tsukamurella hominis TaxID=1970232 RepID=UPI0039EB8A34